MGTSIKSVNGELILSTKVTFEKEETVAMETTIKGKKYVTNMVLDPLAQNAEQALQYGLVEHFGYLSKSLKIT